MAPDIQAKQNHPDNLKLLAAQRQLYSEAKRSLTWRLWVSLALLIFPIFSAFFPELSNIEVYVAIGGLVFLLLSYFFFKTREEKKVDTASRIQEMFDIAVLGIPREPLPFDYKPEVLDIQRAAERHLAKFKLAPNEDFSNLTEDDWKSTGLWNWYAVPAGMSAARAALFYQKRN